MVERLKSLDHRNLPHFIPNRLVSLLLSAGYYIATTMLK